MSEQEYVRYTLRPLREGPADDLELRALLVALQPAGWEEDGDGRAVRFWLARGAEDDETTRRLLRELRARGILTSAAQEAGWRDGWRRFHRPVKEGEVRVRPPWYPPEPGFLDVVIDTGMAFGTGAHVTTRLCLRALQTVPPSSLVDVGTGSGVLALAALRLGFSPVWAMDNDPVAVESCARNAAANDLEPRVFLGDATDPYQALPAAQTMVANLLRGPVLRLAARLRAADGAAWAPERLIVSGLLAEQEGDVLAALPGYRLVERAVASGWLLLHVTRRS